MYGKLYLVATPIGNLQDTSERSLNVLRDVKCLAAEDTREGVKFLRAFNIPNKKIISYREQNHDRASVEILNLLASGEDVALISDRGTPAISDPGYRLVKDAIDFGCDVISIPGPTALISAIIVSGLPTDRFTFLGFLPREKGKIKKLLSIYSQAPSTLIMYESPFRIIKLAEIVSEEFGDVPTAAVKELTKINETVFRGTAPEVLNQLNNANLKGEWVFMFRV